MVEPLFYHGAAGPVRLSRDLSRPAAYMLRIDGTDQSHVDLDDPRRLEFDYVQRIAAGLDLAAPAGERLATIHVGGALMTLPRYLAATRPRSAQVVLEPDEELTAFVRTHLPLPQRSGIKVRPVGGREGIAQFRDDWADAVVLDAFSGSRVPAELTTVEFFTDVDRVLRAGGTFLINITDRGPFGYARRAVAALRAVFPQVIFSAEPSTMKGRRFGNVVLEASRAPLPVDQLARQAGAAPFPYRVVAGAALDTLIGGAAPFTDDDSDTSPTPPARTFGVG